MGGGIWPSPLCAPNRFFFTFNEYRFKECFCKNAKGSVQGGKNSRFLNNEWETRVTSWYLFKTKKYFYTFLILFWHFFQPYLAPKLSRVSVQLFFNEMPWKMNIWTCISTLFLYSWGGGVGRPPALHRFWPPSPAFIGLRIRIGQGLIRLVLGSFKKEKNYDGFNKS